MLIIRESQWYNDSMSRMIDFRNIRNSVCPQEPTRKKNCRTTGFWRSGSIGSFQWPVRSRTTHLNLDAGSRVRERSSSTTDERRSNVFISSKSARYIIVESAAMRHERFVMCLWRCRFIYFLRRRYTVRLLLILSLYVCTSGFNWILFCKYSNAVRCSSSISKYETRNTFERCFVGDQLWWARER